MKESSKPENLNEKATTSSTEPNEERPSFRWFKNLQERRRSSAMVNLSENGYLDEDEFEEEDEEEEEKEKEPEDYDIVSLPPEVEKRRKLIYNFLHTFDVFLSILLFSPLVSIYWYCTWQLIDDYFLKDKPKLSNFITWFIGLSILFPGYVFQKHLQNFYENLEDYENIGSTLQVLMRIIYIYIIALAVVLEWRSIWNLMNFYFYTDWLNQFLLAVTCLLFFCLTRSTHTLVNTPFVLYMDDYHQFFTTESKHQLPIPDYHKFGLDFLFSEIIECFALVAGWRGIEIAYDFNVFPDNKLYSIFASFSISHFIYLFIAVIQTFIFRKFSRADFVSRLLAEDLIHVLMFFSAVLSWKFYWDTVDNYILTKRLELYMLLIGHFMSFFIALAFKVSVILVGPGTSYLKDVEFEEPRKTYFEINYLSTIFKHQLEHEIEEIEDSLLGSQDII